MSQLTNEGKICTMSFMGGLTPFKLPAPNHIKGIGKKLTECYILQQPLNKCVYYIVFVSYQPSDILRVT
jgi:hypothetical protein